ncbi:DUF1572 family protein [Paenibacillus senegalensis]|uniref:DUF1572 family protein n=1 Tax=Paenibacillus senegalensis TaxID=1465766 RepID=UPI00028907A1|nr:DUF1572 family protein [Paenibacillus senegalensis]
MDVNKVYLESVNKQFLYYKKLAEKAVEQLEPEQLSSTITGHDEINSIATVMKHMSGNMLSRWTDFFTSDGEKPWRDRDAEFVNETADRDELLAQWEEAWARLFQVLDSLKPEQLLDIVYIRNEGHTVMEAINRQLAHYPYHVGQIVYAAKLLKQGSWDSLSIPKNSSKQYNENKFIQEKTVKHFTDDELKRLK